jgi:hypothetical protein
LFLVKVIDTYFPGKKESVFVSCGTGIYPQVEELFIRADSRFHDLAGKRIQISQEIYTSFKMPRNTTGGSGHKAQRNSEGSKARNNRCFVDDLLDDYMNEESTAGVYVARVTRRMGSGRMEVFYQDEKKHDVLRIVPMRGGLRGKGKKSVWVDTDSLVMVAETGLGGATHEIVAVFSELQVERLKRLRPNTDPRLFLKEKAAEELDDGFIIREEEDEVDVDAI